MTAVDYLLSARNNLDALAELLADAAAEGERRFSGVRALAAAALVVAGGAAASSVPGALRLGRPGWKRRAAARAAPSGSSTTSPRSTCRVAAAPANRPGDLSRGREAYRGLGPGDELFIVYLPSLGVRPSSTIA